jgi:hypothetical protein
MRTDHEKAHLVGDKRRQQVAEVGDHVLPE